MRSDIMKTVTFPPTSWWVTLFPWTVLLVFGAAVGFGWLAMPVRPRHDTLADGIAALRATDYTTARQVFQTLADKNDPAAEIWLAHLYEGGLGVAPDAQKAVTLLTKAADAGSAEAAGRLGTLYLDGNGVLQDVGAAQTWLGRAAHAGDAAAQRQLGRLYENGLGMAKDPGKAYVWLDIAARNGDALARTGRDRVLATLSPADAAHAAAEAADTLRVLTADTRSGHAPKDDAGKAAQAPAPLSHS
jgi:TPR repeat protein